MDNSRVNVTDKLRHDITDRRTEKRLSSYALSIKSRHSKYWLQNIENGKVKSVKTNDLVSVYKCLFDDSEDDEIIDHIESILNQRVGNQPKAWYELIDISDDFAEEHDISLLIPRLHDLLCDDIYNLLAQRVYHMSPTQAQAALTAVQTLYNSIYMNPELTLALINIPLYGVDPFSEEENDMALHDILEMGAKYNDLVIKHDSKELIKNWHERDKQKVIQDKKAMQEVCKTFNSLLYLIGSMANILEPPIRNILDTFYSSIAFPIEQVCPGSLGMDFPFERDICTGNDFAELLDDCMDWFKNYENTYDLQSAIQGINKEALSTAIKYLKTIDELPDRISQGGTPTAS